MQYDPRRLGLPDLDAVRSAALYLPAGAARDLGRALTELEAARDVIWHLLTLLGERGVTEYGLPPWAEDPTIRGLLIPEAAFLALDGMLGAYRRSCLAAPEMRTAPLPRAVATASSGSETRTAPRTAATVAN